MSAGLRTLLRGVIDYAGLFPPARLPLEEAIRNYARYRAGPDGWMLGRFVCPASRLQELTPFLPELFQTGPPLAIAVLGRGGSSGLELLEGLQADMEAITAFESLHGARVQMDVLETRLPPLALFRARLARELIADVLGPASILIELRRRTFLTPFYEIGFEPDWRQGLIEAVASLTALNSANATAGYILCLPAGFKLRCGGEEPTAFPSAEQVASVLTLCREGGLLLKATAGLHHPIHHFDKTVQASMHGFINLFCAAVLTNVLGLPADRLQALLEDEDASHFTFDDEGLRWQDLHATTAQIAAVREHGLASFGSCSFDEPREDLRKLGWLT
jgi:hypothetical protein